MSHVNQYLSLPPLFNCNNFKKSKYIILFIILFLRFWLAKIPRVVHHNQLKCSKFADYWSINLETRLSCFGSKKKKRWASHSFHQHEIGELLGKNIARTERRHLEGRHLLFGEYLRSWRNLYILNLPINVHYLSKMNSKSMEVSMFYLVFKLA